MAPDRPSGTDPTLIDTPATKATDRIEAIVPPSRASLPGYELRELIGAGGMGEVVLARDHEIGRDVAVKRIRGDASDQATARFLREARIQARLEHPAIVPVYEIGHDDHGKPYFAMKRLAGRTLAELARDRPPRQRMLRMFLDICRAVAFAHEHGVVHRDLKPANVAAGKHGEVYVLDWGLARFVDDAGGDKLGGDVASVPGMTQADAILGTPGYMAPEQVRDAHDVGPAADVYALGAMLFELLAGEPLHAPGLAALAATVAGVDGSPARRRPDREIPPELDAACIAALATSPEQRPSASELADRVERYLDGDRDLERRRALAAQHLATAREALATGDAGRRADVARAAGRALALDPQSQDAAAIVNQLLFETPRELPPALRDRLAASESAAHRRQSRVAAGSYIAIVAFLVALGLDGITSWPFWISSLALATALGAVTLGLTRRAPRRHEMILIAAGNAVLAVLGSRVFGPLIMMPTLICIQVLSFTQYPQLLGRARLVIAMFVASWLVPIGLEAIGWFPETWWIAGNAIHSRSSMAVIGGVHTVALLVCLHVAIIIVAGLFANALAVSRHKALRSTEIREWHLGQLALGERATDLHVDADIVDRMKKPKQDEKKQQERKNDRELDDKKLDKVTGGGDGGGGHYI